MRTSIRTRSPRRCECLTRDAGRWILAGTLALLAFGAFCADQVHARSTEGELISFSAASADDVIDTQPYIANAGSACGSNLCIVEIGSVGEEERLHVDSVSCWIRIAEDGEPLYAAVRSEAGQFDILVPRKTGGDGDSTSYALSHRTNYTVGSNLKFWIQLRVDEPEVIGLVTCKVAGELATLK